MRMGGKRERKGNGVVPIRARAHLEVLQVGVEELLEGGTLHLPVLDDRVHLVRDFQCKWVFFMFEMMRFEY